MIYILVYFDDHNIYYNYNLAHIRRLADIGSNPVPATNQKPNR